MKPIQLNKHQIKGIDNGATMLWIPIIDKNISIQTDSGHFVQSAYNFECDWCKGKDPNCVDCYGQGRSWDIDCEDIKEFATKYSPLQEGQEYYVQEGCYRGTYLGDFIEPLDLDYDEALNQHGLLCVEADTLRMMRDLVGKKIKVTEIREEGVVAEGIIWDKYTYFNAKVEEYKEVKFKPTNIQVKRSQDITHDEIYALYPQAHEDGYDNFMHGFNEKYLDGKYEDNPYGFLITIERIK